MIEEQRTWAEISLGALETNYNNIRGMLDCQYLAVVKANAYGHGDVAIAQRLQQIGADWFGVATMQEGVALRKNGITKPILIFGYTGVAMVKQLASYKLTQTVFSSEYGIALARQAEKDNITVNCHLKLDTGMGRIGFDITHPAFIKQVTSLYGGKLNFTGIFTHFAVADELSPCSVEFTQLQFERFEEACQQLKDKGLILGIRHCANSATSLLYPQMQLDMVRVGIAQYGLDPSPEAQGRANLLPVMSVCSTVALVKEINKGDTVSYGRIYTATEKRRVATITAGYADGYPRNLGGLSSVIIHGQLAPVIGRVCMDQLIADVTHIKDVVMGDKVTLIGSEGEHTITFDHMAQWTNTLNYECICAISPRVPRVYISTDGTHYVIDG